MTQAQRLRSSIFAAVPPIVASTMDGRLRQLGVSAVVADRFIASAPSSMRLDFESLIWGGLKLEDLRDFEREKLLRSAGVEPAEIEQYANFKDRELWNVVSENLKPLLYFDVHDEWNRSGLNDHQLIYMALHLHFASRHVVLEQIETWEGPQRHGGRRKRELESLHRRLADLHDKNEAIEFMRIWYDDVMPVACFSIERSLETKIGPNWRLDPANAEHRYVLLDTLRGEVDCPSHRGKPTRRHRLQTIALLMRHHCQLSGVEKFNWSNALGKSTDGERFVSSVFELISRTIPPPTGEDFRHAADDGN